MEYDIFTTSDGTKRYFKNGTKLLHRKDGAAVEHWNGDKEWYINGKRHREDGPAAESKNLGNEWWANGMRHRTEGPAIEYADGYKAWWINGKRLSPEKETILNQWWDNKNGI